MNIILLGPPGAGKGTIANHLIEMTGATKISTGEYLRKEIRKETELGIKADKKMSKGELVPDQIVNEVVEKYLQTEDINRGLVLDGYPRTLNQAKALNKILKKIDVRLDEVVFVDIDKEELIKRIVDRRTCPNCQSIYNISYDPPKKEGQCDYCGTELVKRSDESEDVIRHRLEVYKEQTSPLINYYAKKGLLKRYSNGSSEEIAKEILKQYNLID